MMNFIIFFLAFALIACFLLINHKLNKEMKRNRVLQSFIAGIIRTISDYKSKTDHNHEEDLPGRSTQLPIPYHMVLENVDWELSKDQLLEHYENWLKQDRDIFFDDKKYGGDGFTFMYLDLFDKKLRRWFSNELMSPEKKGWLSEEITVTKENIGELEGEIGMLKDLIKGDLDSSEYTAENIDARFAIIFNHIRFEKLNEAKKTILSRNNM